MLLVGCLLPASASEDGSTWSIQSQGYVDYRLAAQLRTNTDEPVGLRSVSSRIGAQSIIAPTGDPGAARAILQAEFGFSNRPNHFGLDGTRLLLLGVRGAHGQLSYGRQWSAFYRTVGQYLDAGLGESGFGYPGSERLDRTLQYSYSTATSYLQADLARDPDKIGGGFNRLQLAFFRRHARWRAGLALDISRSSAPPGTLGRPGADCDVAGARCIGLAVGWIGSEGSIDLGAVLAREGGRTTGTGSASVIWKPNQFRYFLEASAGDRLASLAAGLEFREDQFFSYFAESSLVHDERARERPGLAASVGLRFRFDRAW
jgi:hypothetical protein